MEGIFFLIRGKYKGLKSKEKNEYYNLGEAYLKKGEIELAKEYYQKSLKIFPENRNIREMLNMLRKASVNKKIGIIWRPMEDQKKPILGIIRICHVQQRISQAKRKID